MTDTGTETPRNLLPIPKQEEPLNDFLPSPSNTDNASCFWQALTGHPRVFSDISPFFDGNGTLTLPPSESQWRIQEPVVFGKKPEDLLHLSWLGVHDDLRIYVLTPDAMQTMKERLQSSGMQVSSLESNIGIAVERHIPSRKEEDRPRTFLQRLFGRNKERLTQDPNRLKPQYVFFISADRFQTPLDTLALADEIRRLHPKTAERLTLDLLLKLKVAQENAEAWQRVLQSYPEGSVPDYLRQAFTDTQTYVSHLKTYLDQWIQATQQRLGGNISYLPETLRQELQQRTFFFRSQSEEAMQDTINRIIERYHHLPQREQQERTKTLVAYLLKKSLRETARVAIQGIETLNQDPKEWLLEEVAIRGKELLLDTLHPSIGMKEYAQTHGIPPEHIQSVREWIRACKFREQFQNLRRKLAEAQHIQLTEEAKEEEYQRVEQEIQKKIQEIQEKRRNATDHPILTNFSEIDSLIQNTQDEEVKKKLQAVWESRRNLAEDQMHITNLFLKVTASGKGYEGWNPAKGKLKHLLETSPSFIAKTGELNCAGRVILMSSMLLEAGVFAEQDIVVMNKYNHAFLGGFDALGIGRVIEPSGRLPNSYFGIPRRQIFEGNVFGQAEIITQYPLDVKLMIIKNYVPYLLDKKMQTPFRLMLLEKSNYLESSIWNNLSFLQEPSKNFDWTMMRTRAGVINPQFPPTFYSFLLIQFQDAERVISASVNNTKTAPLLPHLKLSLLAMKRTLDDEIKRNILQERIKQELRINNPDMAAMSKNLDQLLKILSNTPLPFSLPDDPREWAHHIRTIPERFGIPEEDARSMSDEELVQQFLWSPDLFPKPMAIKDDGSVEWKMPEQT